jgi:hypothetical protein
MERIVGLPVRGLASALQIRQITQEAVQPRSVPLEIFAASVVIRD